MAEGSDQARPSAYLSGDDYVNGITAQERIRRDFETEPMFTVPLHAGSLHFDHYDIDHSDYYDGYYESDYYDDRSNDPMPDDEPYGFLAADHDHDPEEKGVPDEVTDARVPSHGSLEKLSSGHSRALRYFLKGGTELPGKLAQAERIKKTRKPDKTDEECWKRDRKKQWQDRRYRWVGPIALKQLPVVDQSPSVLVDILDFGAVEHALADLYDREMDSAAYL